MLQLSQGRVLRRLPTWWRFEAAVSTPWRSTSTKSRRQHAPLRRDIAGLSTITEAAHSSSGKGAMDQLLGTRWPWQPRAKSGMKFDVNVSEVPPPPVGKALEDFKEQHINNDVFPGRVRCEDEVRELQFRRLDWARENLHTFINMLRVCGHKDEAIQAMCDGRCPLGVQIEHMSIFRAGLPEFAASLEKELGWKRARFVQTGSNVLGYSPNPSKGFAEQPSKIADTLSSDVDICIVAEGAPAYYEQLERDGKEVWRMPTHLQDCEGLRFGAAHEGDNPALVREWCLRWEFFFPAGLQITVQRELDPRLPAWESWLS